VSERKPYKTDMSDEQWALVEPVTAAWKAAHLSVSGHQGRYEMREIVNALLYQGRTGCQWDLLPHDFPPPGAVKYYFCTWCDDGTDRTIHDLLRWQVREMARRKADPILVVELPAPQPPAPPAPKLPDYPAYPAYPQIMAVFTAADHPLRARQVCEAMDLTVAPNTINNTRLKLKRLADRGILAETEQGLFTQPRP
jgi:transposase